MGEAPGRCAFSRRRALRADCVLYNETGGIQVNIQQVGRSLTTLVAVLIVCAEVPIAIGQSRPESAFLADVTAANYEQLPPPIEPLLLRWNFAEGSVFSYELKQIVNTRSSFSADEPERPAQMTVDATLEMKAEDDRTAKIVLSDVDTTMVVDGAEDDADTSRASHKGQPIVVRGLKEDGTMPAAASQQDALFKLLFPLPGEALAVSESATIPFQFPVNVFGSPLSVDGSVRLTLTGLAYVRGRTCAQIDFNVSVDDLVLPEEIQTAFDFEMSGAGRYFFDIEERRLVEVAVALLTSMTAEVPSEWTTDVQGGEGSPGSTTMSMSSDFLIQLTSD